MSLMSCLGVVVSGFLRKLNRPFKVPVRKQKMILSTFPEPKNLTERSYYQYQCQKRFWGGVYYLVANVVAALLVPYEHAKLKRSPARVTAVEQADLLLCSDDMPENIFPEELLNEFNISKRTNVFEGLCWGEDEERIYVSLKATYRKEPFFIYKNMMKLAGYANMIGKYNPSAVAVCGGEYTYTSAFLTEYCHLKGVEHYNVMHGELFYYILDAFSYYDRFYVWDSHYISLLKQLRAEAGRYIIAIPPSVHVQFNLISDSGLRRFDYKYYLQLQPKKQMRIIADYLDKLRRQGKSVCVRYHPRTRDVHAVYEIFGEEYVESPKEISFEKSLKATGGVIAANSTALFQAYVSGRKYVIDNVSEPEKYEKLKDLHYLMLSKNPELLSDISAEMPCHER